MAKSSSRLALTCAAAAMLGCHASVGDSQVLFQRDIRVGADAVALQIPPLAVEPEVRANASAVAFEPDKEWLDTFHEVVDPIIARVGDKQISGKKRSAAGGNPASMDMSDMMKYLQLLFTAVKSEAFMGNMTQMNTDIRDATDVFHTTGVALVKEFAKSVGAKSHNQAEVFELTRTLFDSEVNNTKNYSDRIVDIAFGVLDSMPADMSDGLRPMMKMMTDNPMNDVKVEITSNCTIPELCSQSDEFFFNLTEGLKISKKVKGMCNSTKKMVPMITDYLDSMRPEVAPRVVFLLEKLMDTTYIVTAHMMDFMDVSLKEVQPVLAAQLDCSFPKSAASASSPGLCLLAALLFLSMAWLRR